MTALRLAFFVFVVIAIAARATGPAKPAAPSATSPALISAPTASASSTLAATPVPAQSPLVVFDRAGGFAGVRDHLAVDSNGHATLTRTGGTYEFDLSASDFATLLAPLRSSSFGELPEDSMPKALPNDAFTYVVTFRGHTARTADTAVPQSIESVISTLGRFAGSRGE